MKLNCLYSNLMYLVLWRQTGLKKQIRPYHHITSSYLTNQVVDGEGPL